MNVKNHKTTILVCFFTLILSGCTSYYSVNMHSPISTNIATQLIEYNHNKVICYSDVQPQEITDQKYGEKASATNKTKEFNLGISCQNTAGFTLFNVEVKRGKYHFDQFSKILSPIAPQLVVNAIIISRFSSYNINEFIDNVENITRLSANDTIMTIKNKQNNELTNRQLRVTNL